MATVQAKKLSVRRKHTYTSINIDPSNYYDYTNQLTKSGILDIAFTSLGITPYTSNQDTRIIGILRPANYDPNHNNMVVFNKKLADFDSNPLTLTHHHWVAYNFSRFDKSSKPEPDGTYNLYTLDLFLITDDFTIADEYTATLTYTIAEYPLDLSVALVGGTDISIALDKGESHLFTNIVNNKAIVQLQSIESVTTNFPTSKIPGAIDIKTGGGQRIFKLGTSRANYSKINFLTRSTIIYAANGGRLSADSRQINTSESKKWSILNTEVFSSPNDVSSYTLKARIL